MTTKLLKLHDSFLPENESLHYRLEMFGAKGSVKLNWEKKGDSATLKCQALASLILPAKKLVDSEMVSTLQKDGDGFWRLIKHVDSDFKTEIKRQFELKEKLIETKYIKFDEERGYLEYPENSSVDSIFDPILALYLLRDPVLQKENQTGLVKVLLRTGILELKCSLSNESPFKTLSVKVVEGQNTGVKVKEPFLSAGSQILVDGKSGIIKEITYPLIGRFGKLTLRLQS
ncbi:MAG: hypothetical protein J0M18_04880 [Ignavibacteria bacterium]|nr:hypothetical protein [Ignavibacteria bacterium]